MVVLQKLLSTRSAQNINVTIKIKFGGLLIQRTDAIVLKPDGNEYCFNSLALCTFSYSKINKNRTNHGFNQLTSAIHI